jgi:flagellar basal body-associated protein FliL
MNGILKEKISKNTFVTYSCMKNIFNILYKTRNLTLTVTIEKAHKHKDTNVRRKTTAMRGLIVSSISRMYLRGETL